MQRIAGMPLEGAVPLGALDQATGARGVKASSGIMRRPKVTGIFTRTFDRIGLEGDQRHRGERPAVHPAARGASGSPGSERVPVVARTRETGAAPLGK